MNKIEERRAQRLQFLNQVFDRSEGDPMEWVNLWNIGEELGWDKTTIERTAQYLVGEGLIEFHALGGELGITHEGVRQIENARSKPQQETQYFPPFIHISGISGSNINIGSSLNHVNQNIGTLSGLGNDEKAELESLVNQLADALKAVPPENAQEAEAVAWVADQLVSVAATDKPNKTKVEITRAGLLKAAQDIAAVTPTVLPIAERIAAAITKIINK
jgi:hypothetical protein